MLSFLTADFAKSEAFISLPVLVQKQQTTTHNLTFLAVCIAGIVYCIDSEFFDSLLIVHIRELLGLESNTTSLLYSNSLTGYYVAMSSLSALLAASCALIFVIKYGHQQNRSDFYSYSLFGNFGPFVHAFITLPIFAALLLVGGYLIAIKLPNFASFNELPGVIVVQILIVAKVQALTSIVTMSFTHQLLPFELHPLRGK